MKHWLWVLALAGVILAGYWQFWFGAMPYTHDSQLHLVRIVQYAQALREKQWPPRIAGSLNNGFGYPVFIFNYPLPYLTGALLMATGLSVELSYKVLTFVSLFAGATGFFVLLKKWLRLDLALIGSLFYILNTYWASLLYVRGGVGEIIALGLMPWMLVVVEWALTAVIPKQWQLIAGSLLVGAFLISHNILVLLSTPFIVGYAIYRWVRLHKSSRTILTVFIIGGLLSCFFWIPALTEKQFTVLDRVSVNSDYLKHFPTLSELLTSPWSWGFSRIGPVDGIPLSLNWFLLTTFLLSGLVILMRKAWTKPTTYLWILTLGLIWLDLPESQWLWKLIPLGHYVQFPWRLESLIWLPLIALMVWFMKVMAIPRWIYWMIGGMTIYYAMTVFSPASTFHYLDANYANRSETTSLADENMPKWFDKNMDYPMTQVQFAKMPVDAVNTVAQIHIQQWDGTTHRYLIETTQPTWVYEKMIYFPGMRTTIDRHGVTIKPSNNPYPGLVSYQVPAGNHEVVTRVTELTTDRVIGDGLTLLGFVGLILMAFQPTYIKKLLGTHAQRS